MYDPSVRADEDRMATVIGTLATGSMILIKFDISWV
jgi:hypothetical protein